MIWSVCENVFYEMMFCEHEMKDLSFWRSEMMIWSVCENMFCEMMFCECEMKSFESLILESLCQTDLS